MADSHSEKKEPSKFCRYFKKGFCGYGEKCLYKHNVLKGRPLPSCNPSNLQNCPFYKIASCKFATKCWYKHIRPAGKEYPKPELLNKFIVVGPVGEEPQETEDTPPAPVEDSAASHVIPKQETEIRRSFKRPQNQDIVPKNCFYYEQKGLCHYGDKCWYTHSVPRVHPADELQYEPEPELDPDHTKMCYNFTFDECEFGDECPYVHGDICKFCDLAFLHPFDEQQREDHLRACEIFFLEDMDIAFKIMRSKNKMCAICLDFVWGANKLFNKQKFGIQERCNHIFCLGCIRKWRAVKRRSGQPKLCPACRTESLAVVPSTHWFENEEEKKQWITAYKAAVSEKICKFYKDGRCQDKQNCLYIHLEEKPGGVTNNSTQSMEQSDQDQGPVHEQEDTGNLAEGVADYDPYWQNIPNNPRLPNAWE